MGGEGVRIGGMWMKWRWASILGFRFWLVSTAQDMKQHVACGMPRQDGPCFVLRCPSMASLRSALTSALMTDFPTQDASGMINLLHFASYGKGGCCVCWRAACCIHRSLWTLTSGMHRPFEKQGRKAKKGHIYVFCQPRGHFNALFGSQEGTSARVLAPKMALQRVFWLPRGHLSTRFGTQVHFSKIGPPPLHAHHWHLQYIPTSLQSMALKSGSPVMWQPPMPGAWRFTWENHPLKILELIKILDFMIRTDVKFKKRSKYFQYIVFV